jgi:hypothetical protein
LNVKNVQVPASFSNACNKIDVVPTLSDCTAISCMVIISAVESYLKHEISSKSYMEAIKQKREPAFPGTIKL